MEITKNEKIILRCNDVQKAIRYAEYAGIVLGARTKVADCVSFTGPGDLAGLLTSLDEDDMLVLYNIGHLDYSLLEYLHGAIRNQKIDIFIDKGPSARPIELDLNPFVPILLVKEDESVPEILNDIDFKRYDVDKFQEDINDQLKKKTDRFFNGIKYFSRGFDTAIYQGDDGSTLGLYVCFSLEDCWEVSKLCFAIEYSGIPIIVHYRNEFQGWNAIKEDLSYIEPYNKILFVLSENFRKDDYLADLVDYVKKLKDKSDIIEYNLDNPEESIEDFCIKIKKILGLDVDSLLSKVENFLSKDCFNEAFVFLKANRDINPFYMKNERLFKYAKIFSDKGSYIHAKDLYEISASDGYAPAQCNLGWIKENSNDLSEAVKWYLKAAEQGNQVAQCNLGYCYEKGRGIKQNYSEAIKWYLEASSNGNKRANDQLHNISNDIIFNEAYHLVNDNIDKSKAFKLYLIGAKKEYGPALCNLGWMYSKGYGVTKDMSEANKWYRKSAEKGYRVAQMNLANNLENGNGINQDYSEAFKWYMKATTGTIGDQREMVAKARYNVARFYENGLGIPKDINEAIIWYEKATPYKDSREKVEMLKKENSLTNKIFKLFK